MFISASFSNEFTLLHRYFVMTKEGKILFFSSTFENMPESICETACQYHISDVRLSGSRAMCFHCKEKIKECLAKNFSNVDINITITED